MIYYYVSYMYVTSFQLDYSPQGQGPLVKPLHQVSP